MVAPRVVAVRRRPVLVAFEVFPPVTVRTFAVPALLAATLLGGCAKTGEIDVTGGVGITAVRSACPRVGIAAGTGDVTLFNPANSRDAKAIDVVATMTNLKSTCSDAGNSAEINTALTFDVLARRTNTAEARDVTLPYYVAVLQGGSAVVAKRLGRVTVHFDAGQERAQVSGQGDAIVSREAATLPAEVREQLTRKRKAGEEDAAIDPLSNPQTRAAVQRATFEAMVGFQLTSEQLQYNASR